MKRTGIISIVVAIAAMLISSCAREDRFNVVCSSQETHTIFNITIDKNTKTRSKSKAEVDSKTSFNADKKNAFIDSDVAFGLMGVDSRTMNVLVNNLPVYEENGIRGADIVTSTLSSDSMTVCAIYPYTAEVNNHKDGSCVISFTPNDIKKGPLVSSAVEMRCSQEFETVNLKFHHISNSIGFKVCDITEDDQLKSLMHVRKVIIHGMPTAGMFFNEGENSYWVAQQEKRENLVVFEGNEFVGYGEESALYMTSDGLSESKDECNRFYVIPEKLKEGRHYVEVVFDVDPFDYDGTHYNGSTGKTQIIPLSGVVPDDIFETGLQYTFVLGMNLCTVYRPIEFSASVEDYKLKYNGRILDYDNE